MKTLEILLRLIDQLLAAIAFKKAQNERDKLEENPAGWFNGHFGGGVSSTTDTSDKTDTPSDTSK